MPLYDIDRGCLEVDPGEIFQKFVNPVARRLAPGSFNLMVAIVDGALSQLKPSKASQLVWTKCAALCGYRSNLAESDTLWQAAFDATTFDPDGPNKFVGSLIMWRISLLGNQWLSAKTEDAGAVHPYRTYWINEDFVLPPPQRRHTAQDLAAKFNMRAP